jgi:hypothetical protein
MPWYQVHLAIDDRTIGKHICLYNMFETLFLGLHEPRGAAMFGHRHREHDYTYYFSPRCSGFFAGVLSAFSASECSPPLRESVRFLAGSADPLEHRSSIHAAWHSGSARRANTCKL